MRRDPDKPIYGGYYEATAGGSALKGEDKITCAMRELTEETGIKAVSLEEIGHCVSHDTIYFNFLCITDFDKASVRTQEGETTSYKWVSEHEFIRFVNSRDMIPTQKNHYMDYFIKMNYIW
jgi:8-oxo-dGTP pyrophosphatase MutT (NUDIX family)